jgi:hypothetical protein
MAWFSITSAELLAVTSNDGKEVRFWWKGEPERILEV